ncbi:hypothetical protein J3458_018856 [Metarhizium acridum]|uniref:uncharacterized protein n=1 Tax=Metarhizium acridum TaxID=92637 RepID=UPI001C6A9B66|nr:hypothetical protein J3458_018856 [Metarhizium acridum]
MVLVCIPFMALIFLLQTRIFTVVVGDLYRFILRAVTFPYRMFTGALQQDAPDVRSVYLAKGRKRRPRMRVVNEQLPVSSRWKWPWQKRYSGEGELGKV